MQNIDLIFKWETDGQYKCDQCFRWSIDGGKTWRSHPIWTDDFGLMVRQAINRFNVDRFIAPNLAPGEELCYPCRNKGRVGVMRYYRHTSGTETQTQMLMNEHGEPYYDDVSYGCSYRIEKCDRCGHEESDYG
jgi:hypothetical protein